MSILPDSTQEQFDAANSLDAGFVLIAFTDQVLGITICVLWLAAGSGEQGDNIPRMLTCEGGMSTANKCEPTARETATDVAYCGKRIPGT